MARISKVSVDAAKPTEKAFFIWDERLKGFGLKVSPTGVKSYVYQYRTAEGRSRRAHVGKHGTWTPDKAREKAEAWQRMVADDGDPLEAKREAREALTVSEALDAYLVSAKFADKAKSTRAIDKGRIKRHLRPVLGSRVVKKLHPEDIRRAFNAIRDGKTKADIKTRKRGRAIVRGGEGTARQAIKLLRSAFSWAVEQQMISSNPAAGVKVGIDKVRNIVMRGPEDYEALFKTLDKTENEKRIRSTVADAIRVIALTGARRGEIAGLRWHHVRLKDGLLIIDNHKTARSTGEARMIGLPAAAQAIIAARASDNAKPDDFVFPPAHGDNPVNLAKPWRMVREEAELPEGIGLHGLRHSLATQMAMDGAQAAEIMTVLGHKQMSTAQKYVHYAQDARAALAERSAAMISGAMKGTSGEVVKLKERAK